MGTEKQEKIEAYLKTIGEMFRGVVRKALAGEGSPRQAIKAKCLTCCNLDRDEITHCNVVICPLHPWRPYQESAAPA